MRFILGLVFVVLITASGVAVVSFSTAEQGSWSLNFSMPWAASQASASQETDPRNAALPPTDTAAIGGQSIGDWKLDCGVNPRTSKKQCTIAQQLTDEVSKSVIFAWLIGNDGEGNLVAVWQTPTGVLVNRGVEIDVGTGKPIAVPYTSCITGHCEAIANLAPDFIHALATATRATVTVYTVAGRGMTFTLSVNGLAEAIDAVEAPTAS